MGRAPCCDKASVKKGPWSPEEDAKLKEHIEKHGTGANWIALPHKAGLKRCGKSCRLRWLNYLRPNIKHGDFSDDEDRIICSLFTAIGSRWSIIAAQLPGRTDNDIKNYWNTKLKKKLIMGLVSIPEIKPNPAVAASSSFSQASPSSPPPYQLSADVWSFVGPANPSLSCNFSSSSTSDGFVGLNMQAYSHHIQENMLSFGGEPSCSSSDGSCSNQLGYGREMEYECGGGGGGNGGNFESREQKMGYFQSGFYGCGVEDHQKPMVSESGVIGNDDGGWREKQSGVWGETPLEYSLEEIKRLISSSNNLPFDENKSGERVMYYY